MRSLVVGNSNLSANLPVTAIAAQAASPACSRFEYMRGAVASPICMSVAAFAGCVGLGYAGLLGAMLAVACVIAVSVHAASYRMVRAYVDDQARARARSHRECQRLKRLRPAGGARQQHYNELRLLVEQVEQLDACDAERFEMQDLLDHFVDLVVHHQRCVNALRIAGASSLPPGPAGPTVSTGPTGIAVTGIAVIDTTRSPRRRDILQRRLQHRDECLRRMEQLTDELEGIDELIRLIVQRVAAAPTGVELDRELDRRLWELDEVDAAMRQLSA
jgi:hypothetical protein